MKNSLHIAVLALLLFAGACVKESPDSGRKEQPGQTALISASLEPATKAEIDGADGSFTWSAGDRLAVWCATGTVASEVGGVYDAATLKSGEGSAEAIFTVALSGYRDRFAVFPWDRRLDASTGGGYGMPLLVNLPAKYTNTASAPLPMVAENIAGEKLEFRHIGSLLRLTLRNLPENVKHIKISTGETITGNFEVDTLSKTEPLISTGSAAGSNGTLLTYSFGTSLPTGGEVTLDVPLPTGLHYNLTVGLYYNNGNYNEFLGRVQRGDVRYFSRAGGKAVTIDLPATLQALRTAMRTFSLSSVGNINVGNSVTMGYTAANGKNEARDDREDAISANDGLTINAWSLDPSVATVTVSELNGKPVLTVKGIKQGSTTIMAMAKHGDDVMYARRQVTVILPAFTLSLSTHEQPIAYGYSRTVEAVCQVDGDPVTADYYEWEITEAIGAADATITSYGPTAVITAGRQGGLVRYVCRATIGGITQTTPPRQVQIVRHPVGTLTGSFTISSDMSARPAFFSPGNLLWNGDEGRYEFESPQYQIYSGVYEATNYGVLPTANRRWDMYRRGVIDLFADESSDGMVYVNENFPETYGWFALNNTQWNYLLDTRKAATVCGTANARYTYAQVGSVRVMVLFPDDYAHPDDRILLRNINMDYCPYSDFNILSRDECALMEAAGAVFLPISGYHNGTEYISRNTEVHYVYYHKTNPVNYTAYLYIANSSSRAYKGFNTGNDKNWFNSIRLVHY